MSRGKMERHPESNFEAAAGSTDEPVWATACLELCTQNGQSPRAQITFFAIQLDHFGLSIDGVTPNMIIVKVKVV